MEKFFRKRWVQYTLIVLVTIAAVALLTRLTNGFTDPIDGDTFKPSLNEDNFFYEKIEDGEFYTSPTVDAYAENGIITFNGKIADTNPNTVDISDSVQLASFKLEPGTYTFSCFNKEKPSWKTYIAVGTYTVDGTKYTIYADHEKAPNNTANDETKLGQTFTLDEAATVTFTVQLMEGVNLDNVDAIPVLVKGDKVGSHSNSLFE